MNNDRRKRIARIADQIQALAEELRGIQEDEQQYADGMPDNLHGSERHAKAEQDASELDCLASELEDMPERLNSVTY